MPASQASDAYTAWIEELMARGLEPWLVTFMFDELSGSPAARQHQMFRIVERAYGIRITRVMRHPRARRNHDRRPIWLGAIDLPIFKHLKQSLGLILPNDGMHIHIIVLECTDRECLQNIAEHIWVEQDRLYRHLCPGLGRIDVRAITHDVPKVVGYVLKQLERRVSADGILILPQAESELSRARKRVGRNSSVFGN